MNHTKHIILNVIYRWLLLWLCTVSFTACSVDEEYGLVDEGVATLQFHISAHDEGDLNTRNSEIGQNSEYMHNLCVLIIKDNILVKKILPNLENNLMAASGNLKTWTSENFLLETGDYTIYVFANIDSYFSTIWSSLTGLGEGESTASLDIDRIVLENPAAKLDLKTYFIPMSVKKNIRITQATKTISIGLDRLVSKIRMNIVSRQAGTVVTDLSFGGYADRVPLITGISIDDVSYETVKDIDVPGNGMLVSAGGSSMARLEIPDFYVNASPKGHPFTVNVKTVEENGVMHDAIAVTSRNELPANSIYPLTLQLNQYDLDLSAQCWISPIGHLPVEVVVGFKQDTYEIEVPEGCQFAFTVNGVNGNSDVSSLTAVWDIASLIPGIVFDGETTDVTTVKGHITASAGKEFSLDLKVMWNDGSASYSRKYTLILKTKDLTEFPFYNAKMRITEHGVNYLYSEVLQMFEK